MSFLEKAQGLMPGQRIEYNITLDGVDAFRLAEENPTFMLTQERIGPKRSRYWLNRVSLATAEKIVRLNQGPSLFDRNTWSDMWQVKAADVQW